MCGCQLNTFDILKTKVKLFPFYNKFEMVLKWVFLFWCICCLTRYLQSILAIIFWKKNQFEKLDFNLCNDKMSKMIYDCLVANHSITLGFKKTKQNLFSCTFAFMIHTRIFRNLICWKNRFFFSKPEILYERKIFLVQCVLFFNGKQRRSDTFAT